MSAAPREAKGHDSRKALALPVGFGTVRALQIVLGIAAVAGAVCLVVATFSTIIEITVGTTSKIADRDTELSGWDRHSVSLILIAAFALVMTAGALRGARPAMAGGAGGGGGGVLVAPGGGPPGRAQSRGLRPPYGNRRAHPQKGHHP